MLSSRNSLGYISLHSVRIAELNVYYKRVLVLKMIMEINMSQLEQIIIQTKYNKSSSYPVLL